MGIVVEYGASGGGGGISTDDLKSDNVAITTAGTNITFAEAFASTDYAITYRCYNASNENIEVEITNKTVNGFTATPYEDGTLEYDCTLNNE